MSNVVALTDRAELWADRIWKTHGNGIAAILAIGADLVAAKKALSHGEWGRMTGRTTGKSMLPFGYATARCLMGIAQKRVIRNVEQCSTFPLSWSTLYELTKLPEAMLEE